jgi:hypothetical protein
MCHFWDPTQPWILWNSYKSNGQHVIPLHYYALYLLRGHSSFIFYRFPTFVDSPSRHVPIVANTGYRFPLGQHAGNVTAISYRPLQVAHRGSATLCEMSLRFSLREKL